MAAHLKAASFSRGILSYPRMMHAPTEGQAAETMRRTTWLRRLLLGVVATAVALGAASAAAAPTAADLEVAILVSPGGSRIDSTRIVPNGGTSTVAGLNFLVGLMVASEGPDPSISKARIELSAGLRWGTNAPRSTQRCTSDAT